MATVRHIDLNDPTVELELGGEYHLSDGRVFWMDRLAVKEILRRLHEIELLGDSLADKSDTSPPENSRT